MNALNSIVVRLRPLNPGLAVTQDIGVKARGLFYELVKEADGGLAASIHKLDGAKPFTCSALLAPNGRGRSGEAVLQDRPYRLRFTALSSETGEALWHALFERQAVQRPIELGPLAFRIERLAMGSEREYWAQAATYQALAQCPPRDTWRLRFRSPTAFRQRTGHLPLPVPACVFGSALQRWNAYCPEPLRMGGPLVDTVAEAVFPSYVDVRSQRVPLEHGCFVGFTGRADLTAVKRLPEQLLAQITALAEFLYFAGVGHGTPRGWGQVAVLDSSLTASIPKGD
jgi:CRISPR-associated endoribonuclease Cas6